MTSSRAAKARCTTDKQLEKGAKRILSDTECLVLVQRSQLKKARLGTATDAVLRILSVPRDFPWLTIRDIIAIGADRELELSLNAVASALANLEPDGFVEVRRDRRPYRYRGCS